MIEKNKKAMIEETISIMRDQLNAYNDIFEFMHFKIYNDEIHGHECVAYRDVLVFMMEKSEKLIADIKECEQMINED